MPYINEGAWALHQGVSDPANIDMIAKKCLNMPMGPLELADLIGLDICVAIMNVMYDGFKEENSNRRRISWRSSKRATSDENPARDFTTTRPNDNRLLRKPS